MTKALALNPLPHGLSILLVEDSASDAVLVEKAIVNAMPERCQVRRVNTLAMALKALGKAEYDVALLDVALLDVALLDVALLDVALLDVALLDVALLDVALLDVALLDVALLDVALLDVALLDVALLDVALLDVALLDVALLDVALLDVALLDVALLDVALLDVALLDVALLDVALLDVALLDVALLDVALLDVALLDVALLDVALLDVALLDVALLDVALLDVALLDVALPDSAEFDGLLSIQNLAPKLPVVILTSYADENVALQAVEHGAQDYLFKDKADGASLKRAMQYAIQRKQFEGTLIKQANFDTLTGLANRTLFESRLDMALARMRRSGSGLGIFFLDLNHFKSVNDTLGHAVGDKLLQQIANRFKQSLRSYDTIARFGGDEFALLAEGIGQARDCAAIAQKILCQFTEPFRIAGKKVNIGASIGIATCFTGDNTGRETLMQRADEAMYGAKLSNHSHYRFYTLEIQEQACARFKLEEELHAALAHDELTLHYQPKIDLRSGRTTGAEALTRWNHPVRGLLLPAEFMAIAEETGLAKELGAWVMVTVCGDLERWREAKLPSVQVAVNLFASQLDDSSLLDTWRALFKKHVILPSQIAVEVPSSALLERTQARMECLRKMHDLHIAVHLDHFGTSAISLAVLKTLPIDAVKIAPELTHKVHEPGGMLSLVQAILDIAERFNIGVIVTGIENEWQHALFKEWHCREGQGFALCRPIPGKYMPDWLSRSNV